MSFQYHIIDGVDLPLMEPDCFRELPKLRYPRAHVVVVAKGRMDVRLWLQVHGVIGVPSLNSSFFYRGFLRRFRP